MHNTTTILKAAKSATLIVFYTCFQRDRPSTLLAGFVWFNTKRLYTMDSTGILRPADMFSVATGRSSNANERRAAKILEAAANQNGMTDPREVTPRSSDMLLTILFNHVKMGSTDGTRILGKDSMGALIQGLQRVYDKAGHEGSWTVFPDGTATGNPTRGNIHLYRLRKAHRSKLAEFGRTTCRAMPLTEEHVTNHYRLVSSEISSDYEYQDGPKPEDRDMRRWALHAVWVVGLHCGLRFDELVKLEIKGISLGSQCCLTLAVKTKNSDDFKTYQFTAWPNADLEASLGMDPNLALFSWLSHRGMGPGYVFCEVHANRVRHTQKWDHKSFTTYMRERLRKIGQGSDVVTRFSGHSIKRGAVQLYRKLGMSDVWIMQRINMVGEGAYTRYTEMYNDAAPIPVPTFSNVASAVKWASGVKNALGEMLDDEEDDIQGD
jgi:hypothetical protein